MASENVINRLANSKGLQMNMFQDTIEKAGYETRRYSGRGMGDKDCLATTIHAGKLGDFIADVTQVICDNENDQTLLCENFRCMQTDYMGMIHMVVYFPDIEYNSDDAEEPPDYDEG